MEPNGHNGHSIDFAKLLERRWPLILSCLAIASLLGGLYHLTARRIHESSVEILVMKKNPAMTAVSGGQSADMQSEVVEDVLATHIRMFGSARVVKDAIESRGLAELPGIQSMMDPDATSPVGYIQDNLQIGRGGEGQAKEAQVLTASFRHIEPEEAQQVLGAIVESYQKVLAQTFENVGGEAMALIEKARAEIGADLEQTEANYAKFRNEAPLMFSGGETNNLFEQELTELNASKTQLVLQKSMIQSRLERIRNSIDGPDAAQFSDSERLALIDDEHVQRLSLLISVERGDTISEAFQADQPARSEAANAEYDRLVSLKTEAGILKRKFGDRHPRVSEVNDSIAELETFLSTRSIAEAAGLTKLEPAKVIAAYIKLLENDLVHIDRRIAEIDALVATSADEAKRLDLVEAQDNMLSGQLERKRELFNAVVSRIPEVGMATQFGGYITEILKPVSTASEVWPNLLIIGALSLILGLGSGTGLALWTEMSDQTFRSADEVQNALGAPVLGVIPKLDDTQAEAGVSSVDGKIVAFHRPKSGDAESIRAVRTALFFASQGSGRTAIQFTSPTPSDGKSLMSANVAVALASAGKSVLLVDADLRKPTQHKLFGVQSTGAKQMGGLANLLIGQVDFPDALLPTGVDNLDLLPAGDLPPNPSELLSMPAFEQFLQTKREQYDYVIVDTPPVLVVSDPLNVASSVDGVILVTPVKTNMAGAAKQAARMLRDMNGTVLGTVVNDLESLLAAEGAQYGGYGRSGYSYGYTKDSSGYTSDEPAQVARKEVVTAS